MSPAPRRRRLMRGHSPADFVRDRFHRQFADPQAIILAMLLLTGLAVVLLAGKILAPVLASVVIAYVLDAAVLFFERRRIPRLLAVLVIFIGFFTLLVLVALALPLLLRQVTQLLEQLPAMIAKGQALLMQLPERYPQVFSEAQVLEPALLR